MKIEIQREAALTVAEWTLHEQRSSVSRDETGYNNRSPSSSSSEGKPQWTRYLSTLSSYAQAVCAATNSRCAAA
ncbi:hypothetical protein J6590_081307 [Homalodisca vitripennis]|nr:hypothetical protein J6590_081307 [Homalodisca vitripennis]